MGMACIMTSTTMVGALAHVPALARMRRTRRGPLWREPVTSGQSYPTHPPSIPTYNLRQVHHVSQSAFGCSRAQAPHRYGYRGAWAGRQRGWLVRARNMVNIWKLNGIGYSSRRTGAGEASSRKSPSSSPMLQTFQSRWCVNHDRPLTAPTVRIHSMGADMRLYRTWA